MLQGQGVAPLSTFQLIRQQASNIGNKQINNGDSLDAGERLV